MPPSSFLKLNFPRHLFRALILKVFLLQPTLSVACIKYFLLKLNFTSRKCDKNPVTLFDGVYIHPESYGTVLVIGAWNFPLLLTLAPVLPAIAAGINIYISLDRFKV